MFHKDGLATSSTKDAPLRKSDKRRLRDAVFEAYFHTSGSGIKEHEDEGCTRRINLVQSLINEALSISGGGDIVARKLKLATTTSNETGTSARSQKEAPGSNSNAGKKQCAKTGTVTLYLRTPPTGEDDSNEADALENADVGEDFRATRWPYRNTMQPLLLEIEHKYFIDKGSSQSKNGGSGGGGGKKGGGKQQSKQQSKAPSQRIVPCLPLLSIIPPQFIGLTRVLVHTPVSKFLCRGAQLMRSGVEAILPAPLGKQGQDKPNIHSSLPFGMHNIQKRGTIVAIYTTKNPLSPPFALGILVADYPTEMRVGPGAKGICCEIVTCYGDDLWRISRDEAQRLIQIRKGQELDSMTREWEASANFGNPGFLDGQFVAAIEEGSSSEEEVDEAEASDLTNNDNIINEDDAVPVVDSAAPGANEPESAISTATAIISEMKVGEGKEEKTEDGETAEESDVPDDSDQDALLLYSFHRALVTTVTDKILPMSVAALYASHILPARPKGTTLDLKKTQFKKMGLFLYAQQQPQQDDSDDEMPPLIETKPSEDGREAIAFLSKVNRSHPALRRMKQLVKKEKESSSRVEGAEASTSLTIVRKLAIVNLYKIPKQITSSMNLNADDVAASNAASDARRGTGFLTGKEVTQILNDYIKEANLADKGDVTLDEPLFAAVMKLSNRERNEQHGQKSASSLEVGSRVKRKDLQERWIAKMEAAYALVAVPGNEVLSLKKGTPKKIDIEVEKRQGNRKYSTHVRGLEEYGIDGAAFASDVAKRFACSASVDANPTGRAVLPKGCVECTFQGHLSEELKALLTGDERICSHGGCRNGTYFVPKVVINETLRKGVPAKKKR